MSLLASSLISKMLFIRANAGANGKADTKSVANPNWITEKREYNLFILFRHIHSN